MSRLMLFIGLTLFGFGLFLGMVAVGDSVVRQQPIPLLGWILVMAFIGWGAFAVAYAFPEPKKEPEADSTPATNSPTTPQQ